MNEIQVKVIQDKYNKLHQMIILGEQEVTNLKKAKVAEQSEIQRLLRYGYDLKEQNTVYFDKIKDKKEELEKINAEHDAASVSLSDTRVEHEKLKYAEANLMIQVSKLNDEALALQKEIRSKRIEFNEVSKKLEKEKSSLQKFTERAKELLTATLIIVVMPMLLVLTVFYLYEVTDSIIAKN